MLLFRRFVFCFFVAFSLGFPTVALAEPLSHPGADPNFFTLPDGRNLYGINVSGAPLRLASGSGKTFSAAEQEAFARLRQDSQTNPKYPVQWVLMDLDTHKVVESSANPDRKQFGASVSKIYVAAALMDKQHGGLTNSQLQLFSEMLVVSSNSAWVELQDQIGGGDSNRGREFIHRFTQRMGYLNTRGFQGYWGEIHGNELTPRDLAEFLYDTYQARYPGAAVVWKVLHASRTGSARAKKYLPADLFVGGKTGTYDGPTVDPETGSETGPDGKPYEVRVRHQVIVFHKGGREYGLSILADTGSDESAALLAGGLYRLL